jgi:putative NADH-flavin reductase
VQGDILDRGSLERLALDHDALIVSVGGAPNDNNPAAYIANQAARSLIEVLDPLGTDGPRVIFVGNVNTLQVEPGRAPLSSRHISDSDPNFSMHHGHQFALDAFLGSDGIQWTVATPPNGLRHSGRTGKLRWGEDTMLRDQDGTLSTISPEDFAFAVFQELENGRYVRRRFTVAR